MKKAEENVPVIVCCEVYQDLYISSQLKHIRSLRFTREYYDIWEYISLHLTNLDLNVEFERRFR